MNDRYMEGNFHNSIRKERCSYWLLCLVIIALGIRIIGIRARDLYCDEAAMMLYAKMPWRGLMEILPRENYGPLYFIVQKSWNGLMEGYVWARLLSVTCGIVLVIALFGIGYHMQNRKLGWLAGLIAATNCFLVAFSQKIWSYIPCATFVTLTAWLAMQLIVNANLFEDAHPPSYNLKLIVLTAGCWLTATVAFYMHYIALPVLIGIALAVAWELWRVKAILRIWLLTQLAFLCSIAPWLKVLSMRAIAIAHGFHMKHTSISGVLDMFHDFSLFAPSIHHAILSARIVTAIGILAFGYLLIRGTLIAWHNLRYRFALSVFALGLLLWCIIAIFMPVWHPRALLPLAPFYLLIIAIGIMAHSHWRLYTWATLLIALQIASLSFYFGNDAYAEAQWRLAARYLQGHRSSNEPILHTSVLSFPPVVYYMGNTSGHKVIGLSPQNATPATWFVLLIEPRAQLPSAKAYLQDISQFWLVETTDWRPWVDWHGDRMRRWLEKLPSINLKLMCAFRGVSIYYGRTSASAERTRSRISAR